VDYSLPSGSGAAAYEARIVPLAEGRSAILVFEVTERARAAETLRIRLEQQSAVARLGLNAIGTDDIQSLLDSAVRSVAVTLDVELCKVLELMEDGQTFLLRAGVGWNKGLVGAAEVPAGTDSQAGYTLLQDHPLFVQDLRADSRFRGPALLVEHGVTSGLSVVIRGRSGPFGVLGAHTRQPRTFTREDGNFLQAVANVISQAVERQRAEQHLRESEERFRSLIERSSDLLFLIDQHAAIKFASPSVQGVLGYTPAEMTRMIGLDVVEPEALAEMQRELRVVLAQPGVPHRIEVVPVRHKDGSPRILDALACNQLHVPALQSIVVNMRDVTTQHRLERQLERARRLESVGRLAGGIAHDFNNLLTAILGHAEILAESPSLGTDEKEELHAIRESVQRARDLVQRLLAFARKQVLKPRVLDLNHVVRDTDRLLRRLLPENVAIRTYLVEPLWPVLADPSQIEQVIVNLVVNARDAMPDGGTLTIETANVELDADYVRAQPGAMEPGPHAMLAISDSGVGMQASVLEHAFEPFFTTKPIGEGAGLGLSTVYGIVKQSGGHTHAYSEPGVGSTFKIYLPRTEGTVDPKGTGEPVTAASGTETILLVEDDEAVLNVTRRMLESAGYRVVAASGPDAALEVEAQLTEGFDLLVTDVVMAGMSGKALARVLNERRPGLAVLYISGYTENAIVHHGVVDEGTHFLAKPFGRLELLAKVREVLDSRDRPA
jgi:PAS domain S-box-containing protein